MKKWIVSVLCVLMLLGMTGAALAEQVQEEAPVLISSDPMEIVPEYIGGGSVDSRLMSFLQGADENSLAKSVSTSAKYLNTMERRIYEASKALGEEVAWGRQTTLQANVELDYPAQLEYTAEELGVKELITNGKMNPDAQKAMQNMILSQIDMRKVYDAVRRDCPLEFYWEASYTPTLAIKLLTNGQTIWFTEVSYIQWYAAQEFGPAGTVRDYATEVDAAKTTKAASTVKNARSIVSKYAGLSDYEKLDAYQKEICRLTDYNDDAVDVNYPYYYGNPWQILYAFDGDPDTKVVCEGYAKSFQYLCELSSFSSNVQVLSVIGSVNGGAHMWNIVRTADGRNHHVDVTWSDDGDDSNSFMFFTVPDEGSVEDGYWFYNGTVYYAYADRMLSLYPAELLDLLSNPGEGPEIITQPEDVTTSRDNFAEFTIEAAGEDLTYEWQMRWDPTEPWEACDWNASYTTAAVRVPGYISLDGAQLRCIVRDGNGAQTISDIVTLHVVERPTVITQPENQTAEEGAAVTFHVEAEGYELSYHWRGALPGCAMEDGSSLPGAPADDSDTFTFTAQMDMDGLRVVCRIEDPFGGTEYSEMVTLTVIPGLRITANPADATVPESSTASFTVAASTPNVTYRWQYRNPTWAANSWTNCTSATVGYNTDTLQPVGTAARNGYQYRCVITDAQGQKVISGAATLNVVLKARITSQPVSVTINENLAAAFHVEASGTGLTYRWQFKNTTSTGWSSCSSATEGYNTDTLHPVATKARNGYSYRCLVTDAMGSKVYSAAAVLTVKEGVKIISQPVDTDAVVNSSAAITVAAEGEGLTYQWQYKTATGTTWAKCSSATVGYNTATVQPVASNSRNGYSYRCIITDQYGKKVTSSAAVLHVLPGAQILAQPVSQSVPAGESAAFTVTASGVGLTYQWQYKNATGTSWVSCSSATVGYRSATLQPVSNSTRNGYSYRCMVTDQYGNRAYSDAAVLTLKRIQAAEITVQPMDCAVPQDETATFAIAATGDGLKYQWQYKNSFGGSWANCSASTVGYNTSELHPVATKARNGYQYRCIVTDAAGNKLISDAAVLSVLEPVIEPVVEPSEPTIEVDISVFPEDCDPANPIEDYEPEEEPDICDPAPEISDFEPDVCEPAPEISDFDPDVCEPAPEISDFDPVVCEPAPEIADLDPETSAS